METQPIDGTNGLKMQIRKMLQAGTNVGVKVLGVNANVNTNARQVRHKLIT